MPLSHYILSPAYGRTYPNQFDAREDYRVELDFVHETRLFTGGGLYISRRDIPEGAMVELWYGPRSKSSTFLQEHK